MPIRGDLFDPTTITSSHFVRDTERVKFAFVDGAVNEGSQSRIESRIRAAFPVRPFFSIAFNFNDIEAKRALEYELAFGKPLEAKSVAQKRRCALVRHVFQRLQ